MQSSSSFDPMAAAVESKVVVPELVLKKQKRNEEWELARKEALEKQKNITPRIVRSFSIVLSRMPRNIPSR